MKAKRIKGDTFYCGCGSAFNLTALFNIERNGGMKDVDCKNCGAKYQFREIYRYTVTPLKANPHPGA